MSHKLNMGTKESKERWHNVAKDTLYNFAPRLDNDMIASKKNLADAETNLKHKWVFEGV